MSLIRISYLPTTLDALEIICAKCFEIQLIKFRNGIKERWNRANHDGHDDLITTINFEVDPKLLWEEAIVTVNGTDFCATHYFTLLNATIEQAALMQGAVGKPKLVEANALINPKDLRG